ncbi:hypothetical protein LCGC14_1611390 [marine sediment metagenome]|uniref:Uncharacterized protein n=1 Tax=marine sediment metagenome TaxID=412755 RepID=A0A0F9I8G4_9ZZZZ
MKTLHIPLEDKTYNDLIKVKGKRTWYKFIEDIISSAKKIEEILSNDKRGDEN